jgi:hypothetical protein
MQEGRAMTFPVPHSSELRPSTRLAGLPAAPGAVVLALLSVLLLAGPARAQRSGQQIEEFEGVKL